MKVDFYLLNIFLCVLVFRFQLTWVKTKPEKQILFCIVFVFVILFVWIESLCVTTEFIVFVFVVALNSVCWFDCVVRPTHLDSKRGFESIPFHLADKSARLMCHGIQPNPGCVCLRTFCMVHRSRANIPVYCPIPNSTMDHNLSARRSLHDRRQISHESFFPSICWDPKSILCGVFLYFRLDSHCHQPEIMEKRTEQRLWAIVFGERLIVCRCLSIHHLPSVCRPLCSCKFDRKLGMNLIKLWLFTTAGSVFCSKTKNSHTQDRTKLIFVMK